MKIQDLLESKESKNFGHLVNASIKAYDSLSYDAKRALDEWESNNWDRGRLVKSHSEGTGVIDEINTAFEPVRKLMHRLFGDTIKIHRGQRHFKPDQLSKDRNLFSFSFDENVARAFAHGRIKHKVDSIEDIKKAVATYERTGFVSFGNKKYKRIPETPQYFWIYDRNNNVITDGDNLEELLMDNRKHQLMNKQEDEAKGEVHSIDVPIDKIVWLSNRLGSKEFIAALNPIE